MFRCSFDKLSHLNSFFMFSLRFHTICKFNLHLLLFHAIYREICVFSHNCHFCTIFDQKRAFLTFYTYSMHFLHFWSNHTVFVQYSRFMCKLTLFMILPQIWCFYTGFHRFSLKITYSAHYLRFLCFHQRFMLKSQFYVLFVVF